MCIRNGLRGRARPGRACEPDHEPCRGVDARSSAAQSAGPPRCSAAGHLPPPHAGEATLRTERAAAVRRGLHTGCLEMRGSDWSKRVRSASAAWVPWRTLAMVLAKLQFCKRRANAGSRPRPDASARLGPAGLCSTGRRQSSSSAVRAARYRACLDASLRPPAAHIRALHVRLALHRAQGCLPAPQRRTSDKCALRPSDGGLRSSARPNGAALRWRGWQLQSCNARRAGGPCRASAPTRGPLDRPSCAHAWRGRHAGCGVRQLRLR